MDSFENILKKYQDIALSNSQVLKLVDNKCNIVLYPELINYNSIDELLHPYGACIILYVAKFEPHPYGHWCLIFKQKDDLLEFFNPYGGWPDDPLKHIPFYTRQISNQNFPLLSYLMYISPYDLSYNEHKFQKHGRNIKTCGRWCAFRLLCRNYNLEQFYLLIKELKNLLNLNGDEVVTLLTMYINK